MSPDTSYRVRRERGATIVFVALALTALLSVVALAVDVGMLLTAKTEAQRTADAAAMLKTASDGGNAMAETLYANMLQSGQGVAADPATARTLYEAAANAGFAPAQFSLGSFYESGLGGLTADIPTAVSWYQKAADQGMQPAADKVAELGGSSGPSKPSPWKR